MKFIKSLLATTDFSDNAGNGLARAARIAAEQGAALTLLHVVSASLVERMHGLFRDAPEDEANMMAEAGHALGRLAADIADVYHVEVSWHVKTGVVPAEILAAAGGSDLLVMGARGMNPLRDLILGTTAERLLGKWTGRSLVVKRAPQEAYRRVIVPVDYSECSAPALEAALGIAPDAQIWVCHAYDAPFEGRLWMAGVPDDRIQHYRDQEWQQALAGMERLIAAAGADAARLARVVEHGDPNRVILDKEEEHNADLIVIGKHGQSAVEEFFLGSVTRHVLANSKCDVMVVHEQVAG